MSLKTSILFLVFNRPTLTREVFKAIKDVSPAKLYIAADGPREDKPDELRKCVETREIVKEIDWDCEIKTLFREKNLGCRDAVADAITWFFQNEEQGIILEDDCIPDKSFFFFCDELLTRYKDNERIMQISGGNPYSKFTKISQDSYYFKNIGYIWGWASWARAWKLYSKSFKSENKIQLRDNLKKSLPNSIVRWYYRKKFAQAFSGEIDTWDYQWEFFKLVNSGLSVIPKCNLIENIGFGPDATHTTTHSVSGKKMPTCAMDFPLKHPENIQRNTQAENYHYKSLLVGIIQNKLKKLKLSLN